MLKLYAIIPEDLKGSYALAQVFHLGTAASQRFLILRDYRLWLENPTVVIWSLPRELLEELVEQVELTMAKGEYAVWREPDKDHKVMGICFVPQLEEELDYDLERLLHLRVEDMQLA